MSEELKTDTTMVDGRPVQVTVTPAPTPAPTPTPAPAPSAQASWGTKILIGAVIIFGAIGAYTQYVGPIHLPNPTPAPVPAPGPKPAPTPTPAPAPAPAPDPVPSDLWSVLQAPSKNEVSGLKLPAPIEVPLGKKYIQVTADCKYKVHWLVSGRNAQAPIETLESPVSNTILVLPGGEDIIVVIAYSVDDKGLPTEPAITYLKVNAPAPEPEPKPDPTPSPTPSPAPTPKPGTKPTKVHLTFIYDKSKQTRAISDVVNDAALRASLAPYLADKVHELDPNKDKLADYHLDTYVTGKTLPIMVIQTSTEPGIKGGDVVFSGTFTSSQQVKDAVNNVLGVK